MAVSESDLKAGLESTGAKIIAGPKGEILTAIDAGASKILIHVNHISNGEMIQFRTVRMLEVPTGKIRRDLLRILLHSNYEYKMVKFAYDKEDGEVVAYLDIQLGDARMTPRQITRYFTRFGSILKVCYPRYKTLIETGEDPGEHPVTDAGDIVDRLADMLADGSSNGSGSGSGSGGADRRPQRAKGNEIDDIIDDLLDDDPR